VRTGDVRLALLEFHAADDAGRLAARELACRLKDEHPGLALRRIAKLRAQLDVPVQSKQDVGRFAGLSVAVQALPVDRESETELEPPAY
jgi:hypothetical protein